MTNEEYILQCEKTKTYITFQDLTATEDEYIEFYNNPWFKESCKKKHLYVLNTIVKKRLYKFAAYTDVLTLNNNHNIHDIVIILIECLRRQYYTIYLQSLYQQYYNNIYKYIINNSVTLKLIVGFLKITPYNFKKCYQVVKRYPKILNQIKNLDMYEKIVSQLTIDKLKGE